MIDLEARLVAAPRPLTFPEILELLHTVKYTGPVTFHLIHGVPTVVELAPQTTKVAIARAQPLTPSPDLAHTAR